MEFQLAKGVQTRGVTSQEPMLPKKVFHSLINFTYQEQTWVLVAACAHAANTPSKLVMN